MVSAWSVVFLSAPSSFCCRHHRYEDSFMGSFLPGGRPRAGRDVR